MADPQTIDLNGNKYDAMTGRTIPSDDNRTQDKPIRRTIDGVIGTIRPHNLTRIKRSEPRVTPRRSNHASSITGRIPEHSKTLLRNIVNKPEPRDLPSIDKKLINEHRQKRLESLGERTTNLSNAIVDKAQAIRQSELIKRFNPAERLTPVNTPTDQKPPSPIAEVHQKNLEQLAKQAEDPDEKLYTDAALELADSYKPLIRKRIPFYARAAQKLHMKPKTFLSSCVVLIVLIVGGFGLIHYYNSLYVYVSDIQLHFNGHLPSVTSPGFRVGSIKKEGQILAINYVSNSDSRNYQVFEQLTNWDSEALLSAVVTPSVGNEYSTLQIGGRTVYSYKQIDVWIDGGIYYKIDANLGNLSQDQINSVIDSL